MLTARDIMVKPDPRMRLEPAELYNLQIKNIKETDAGDYSCKVSVLGQPVYITHTLEILGKSSIKIPGRNLLSRTVLCSTKCEGFLNNYD